MIGTAIQQWFLAGAVTFGALHDRTAAIAFLAIGLVNLIGVAWATHEAEDDL